MADGLYHSPSRAFSTLKVRATDVKRMAGPDKDKPSSASANQRAEPSSADSNESKKAADTVLDARRSAVDNIMAGKPAPYFLVDPAAGLNKPSARTRTGGYGGI